MSLAEWSNIFGPFALCRNGDMQYELANNLLPLHTAYAIILGSKERIHLQHDEVVYLLNRGFFEQINNNVTIRAYSLFESKAITEKLLSYVLTPKISFYESRTDENAIFMEFDASLIGVFDSFVNYIQEDACIWMTVKHEGLSKLKLNYLHSHGPELHQFGMNLHNLTHTKTFAIYENLKTNENWYFKRIRSKRFYDAYGNMPLQEFKHFIRWKWIHLLLPIAINEDLSNISDLNKFLIAKVSTKLKIALDADDVINVLGIHICQLIPDTLKILFQHDLNLSSFALVSLRRVKVNSLDQWAFSHGYEKEYMVYKKMQKFPGYFDKSRKWYYKYLVAALQLDNNIFELFMRDNQLIDAAEYINNVDHGPFGIYRSQIWSEFKLKKIYEILNMI